MLEETIFDLRGATILVKLMKFVTFERDTFLFWKVQFLEILFGHDMLNYVKDKIDLAESSWGSGRTSSSYDSCSCCCHQIFFHKFQLSKHLLKFRRCSLISTHRRQSPRFFSFFGKFFLWKRRIYPWNLTMLKLDWCWMRWPLLVRNSSNRKSISLWFMDSNWVMHEQLSIFLTTQFNHQYHFVDLQEVLDYDMGQALEVTPSLSMNVITTFEGNKIHDDDVRAFPFQICDQKGIRLWTITIDSLLNAILQHTITKSLWLESLIMVDLPIWSPLLMIMYRSGIWIWELPLI